MPFKRSVMRFAHSNGYTHCCYTENAEYVKLFIVHTNHNMYKHGMDLCSTFHCVIIAGELSQPVPMVTYEFGTESTTMIPHLIALANLCWASLIMTNELWPQPI